MKHAGITSFLLERDQTEVVGGLFSTPVAARHRYHTLLGFGSCEITVGTRSIVGASPQGEIGTKFSNTRIRASIIIWLAGFGLGQDGSSMNC